MQIVCQGFKICNIWSSDPTTTTTCHTVTKTNKKIKTNTHHSCMISHSQINQLTQMACRGFTHSHTPSSEPPTKVERQREAVIVQGGAHRETLLLFKWSTFSVRCRQVNLAIISSARQFEIKKSESH